MVVSLPTEPTVVYEISLKISFEEFLSLTATMTTTTTTQQSYVVYSLSPDPYPDADERPVRYDGYDKKFATTLCLFTIIASVVLICLFFLIGHSFAYILLIIIIILLVALFIAYRVRRPAILFPLRTTTSVKFPNSYAMHVIPGPQLPHIYRTDSPDNKHVNFGGVYLYPNGANVGATGAAVYPAPAP
ncbi:unnamed protein product, partial [Oppiella nova]